MCLLKELKNQNQNLQKEDSESLERIVLSVRKTSGNNFAQFGKVINYTEETENRE